MLIADPAPKGGPVSAAMEERGIPFHLAGPAALFQRPEVRDAIAWLRVLADPDDSPAAARALTRPPIELRAGDLARLTTIARRRKVDMVSACEAALESPQIPPEARERIQAFLKLYGDASAAMEERRADVFVRRLIERVGLRRQRLFAAQPEVAERLLGLSRLAELATAWARREPHGSTRGFVALPQRRRRGRGRAGRRRGAALAWCRPVGLSPTRPRGPGSTTSSCSASRGRPTGADRLAGAQRLVLSRSARRGARPRSRLRGGAGRGRSGEEEQGEELFGPAEGLHATYRKLREEVLEASWRAGRELSEPRLDTAIDVNRAIARYLELLKLAALAQRPGEEPTAEAIAAVNGLLRQVATPEQQAELDASSLDAYLLDSEQRARRPPQLIAAREEPSLEAFLPRRGDGRPQPLRLRSRPLPDLPAEVQVRAASSASRRSRRSTSASASSSTAFSNASTKSRRRTAHVGWRADGPLRVGLAAHRLRLAPTTSCSSATAPARRCASTGSASGSPRGSRSGSSASSTSRSASTTCAAASTASTACPTATTS